MSTKKWITIYALFFISVFFVLNFSGCSSDDYVPTSPSPFHQELPPSYAFTTNIKAGQNIDVGDIHVWNDNSFLYVNYVTTDNWWFTKTHLHVATSLEGIPQTNKGNPKVGQFDHHAEHNPHVQTYIYTIPITWAWNTELYIAAHCKVVLKDNNGNIIQSETGWGEGTGFPGNNWAMYFTYNLQEPVQCLVAYYPFNGNGNDESGNGNHGTIVGATLTTDRFNNLDAAYLFNNPIRNFSIGNTNLINCGHESSLQLSDVVSISMWFNSRTNPYGSYLIGKAPYTSPSFEYTICWDHWGEGVGLRASIGGLNPDVLGTTFFPTINTWYHVVVTWQYPGSFKIYLNGSLLKSQPTSGGLIEPTNQDVVIGCIRPYNEPSIRYFNGKIDDVRIYKCVLTDSEIQNLYHEGGW